METSPDDFELRSFGEPCRVHLFVDEIKPERGKSPFAYVGLLSIDAAAFPAALERLHDHRRSTAMPGELKFSKVQRTSQGSYKLAHRWLGDVVDAGPWHFTVLAVDTEKLTIEMFGESVGDQIHNLHRRFLRSAVLWHLKSCHFKTRRCVVKGFFHDTEGVLEQDPYFPWHGIRFLQDTTPGIDFGHEEIYFVHSDHTKEQKFERVSHALQLCDLVLGVVRHAHEDSQLFMPEGPEGRLNDVALWPARDKLAWAAKPLLDRITHPQDQLNRNSEYRHVGRCSFATFPTRSLEPEEFDDPFVRVQSSFNRCPKLRLFTQADRQASMEEAFWG